MSDDKPKDDNLTENPSPAENVEGVKPEEKAAEEKAAEETKTEQKNVREPGTPLTEEYVREALKEVIDPELFVNIVDLGLVYTVNVKEREDKQYDVDIEMTMTSPMCPAGPQLVGGSRSAVAAISDVVDVDVKVVMDPPWNQDMMTDDAKDQLNIF